MESILISVKRALGLVPEVHAFDSDLIIYINTALATLVQLGVTSAKGKTITDDTSLWTDIFDDDNRLGLIKTFIISHVRLAFDPPSNSYTTDAIKNRISELEWRITNDREE